MTRVLIIEPGYCPYQAAFDSPQAAISEVIEGDSLLLKPFGTSKIGVVCSKNQSRLKYNRQLEDGCTIRGRFLVCGLSESTMLGLSKDRRSAIIGFCSSHRWRICCPVICRLPRSARRMSALEVKSLFGKG